MKKVFAIAALVLLSLPALAESKTIPVTLNGPTMVNGTSLKAGDYKVVVTVNGTEVKATFVDRDKKEVANADAKFVNEQFFPTPVSVVVGDQNGTRVLREIWVSKMKGAIMFASNAKTDASKQ